MQPAAVLSILVKSQGVASTAADLRSLDKAGRNAGAGLQKTEGHARKASKSFSVLGAAAKTTGLLVGGAGLVKGLQLMNSEYREAQKVGAQTNAVLKSTGRAANVTKKQIQDLATAISKKAGIDDEAIQKGENLLLTFRDIRNETGKGNDIFNQATQAITDVSVAMDQGLKQSAVQVGKALNDPIKGMTALRRIGVTFSQSQVDTVKKLVNTGDKLGAQKLILRELRKEFAGSAAAQATAGDKLKVAWNNLAEAAGGILVPMLDKVATFMTNVINQFVEGKGIAKFIVPVFTGIRDAIAGILTNKGVIQFFKDFATAMQNLWTWGAPIVQTFAPKLLKFFQDLPGPIKTALEVLGGFALLFTLGGPLTIGIAAFVTAAVLIQRNWSTVGPILAAVSGAMVTAFNAMVTAVNAVAGAFTATRSTISSVMNAITTEVGKWKVAAAVFGFIAGYVKIQIGVLVTVVKAGMALLAPVFTATFGVIKAIVTGAWSALKATVSGGLQAIHGVIQVFGGIFKGDFGQIWEGIKNIFRGVGSAISGILRAQLGTIRDAGAAMGKGLIGGFKAALNLAHELAVAMRDLISKAPGFALGVGQAIVRGIINGIKSAAGSIGGALKGAVKSAAPGFLGIGEGIGKGVAPAAGKASKSLMGASSSLAPFAAAGARFGLSVSSGRRPGAITSSGNVSYHSTGEAIDEAGPPAGMMAFFKYMKGTYGSRLAELIYGPGKIGIKNGQPFNFGPALNAQHMDHVHVALDTGKPGPGDGIGKARHVGRLMGDGLGKAGLEALWQRAGGSAGSANIAAAVALAESGGRPSAKNINSDGSIDRGLWQINSVHGAQSTFSPLGNARAAVNISSGGTNWSPWVTYKTGAYRQFLGGGGSQPDSATALKARVQSNMDRVDALRAKLRNLPSGKKYAGQRLALQNQIAAIQTSTRHLRTKISGIKAPGKATSAFDQAIATADVNIAQTKTTGSTKVGGVGGRRVSNALAAAGAVRAKEKIVGARIQKIRAALKGKLTPATRLRLTQELAQQLDTHKQLDQQATALMHPAATTGAAGDIGGGDLGGDTSAADAEQAQRDADQQAAMDSLTEQLRITNERLALQATLAQEALRKYNVSQSDYGTLQKALAQIVSGELGGKIGLGFMTPGFSGGGSRY